MKLFDRIMGRNGRTKGNAQNDLMRNLDDDFSDSAGKKYIYDPYLYNAWVNTCVGILIRNVARAGFMVMRNGNEVTAGRLCELFQRPNRDLSSFDLWKQTAAWWTLEGEAFWWFGKSYAGGIPNEIHILDPRRMRHESEGIVLPGAARGRWFYQDGSALVTILPDELIHFREWNPWNPWNPLRGVDPLASLRQELEQDYYANRANAQLLKYNAVPQGILKTDQVIRPEEADALERRWEAKYGEARMSRKIAVLGKGTEFKALNFTPENMKLFELKRWIVYTIIAKYGIPPKVANVQDKAGALSGKDTAEQHAEFWKYTIVPLLKNFEDIIKTQFFMRFGLKESGKFDLRDIPELQQSEDEQSSRDIAEMNAGLKTINDVLREQGKEPKPWGDIWYRPKNLIPIDSSNGT